MRTPSDRAPDDHEEVFVDGNMTPVVRRGNVVVRRRAPWSDASHAVLRHLERVGFDGAPRVVRVDQVEETLGFVQGSTIPPDLVGFLDDGILIDLARRIRGLHEAMTTFVPDPDLAFPRMPLTPAGTGFVCHNDLAPWNTVIAAGQPPAFIDWDLASPAPPTWDLVYAAWRFVPLYPADSVYGDAAERGRRLRLFLDTYELPLGDRQGFIGLVRRRELSAFETVEQWGRAGIAGFDRLYQGGLHLGALDDIAWLDRHALELRAMCEP